MPINMLLALRRLLVSSQLGTVVLLTVAETSQGTLALPGCNSRVYPFSQVMDLYCYGIIY